jgi:hypothetical protein
LSVKWLQAFILGGMTLYAGLGLAASLLRVAAGAQPRRMSLEHFAKFLTTAGALLLWILCRVAFWKVLIAWVVAYVVFAAAATLIEQRVSERAATAHT